jgi:hypothetical protein
MIELFMEGGVLWMSILTLELIALLLAAWKAPAWVKEIGLIALVTGLLGPFFGMTNAADAVQQAGDISPSLLAAGFKFSFINIIYGLLIYLLSLIIRIIQKPRFL